MSPPISMSVMFHKCWMERLQDCCQYCGEIGHLHNNTTEEDRIHINVEITHEHTHTNGDKTQDSGDTTDQWTPWEGKRTQHKMTAKKHNKNESIVRLVYPKRLFKGIQKEADMLLRQLPFPACFELVNDITENEEEDERLDMMADLADAYKLHGATITNDLESDDDNRPKNK